MSPEHEKLISVTQICVCNEQDVIRTISFELKNGVPIKELTTIMNEKYGIALDNISELIEELKKEFGMYEKENRLYFIK